MDGRWVGVLVDESDNSLSSSGHLEGVTRGDSTVTSEGGGTQVGVDLEREGGDVVLEEINLFRHQYTTARSCNQDILTVPLTPVKVAKGSAIGMMFKGVVHKKGVKLRTS